MIYAELFEDILQRPGMYVGHGSIIRIKSFMDGYIHAIWKEGKLDQSDAYFDFQKFVENRFEITQHSWDNLISFMCLSEAEAFEDTKTLWAQYKAQHELNR